MTGDTVVVPRIDRLARNLTEGLKTIEELHDKGINIRSLAERLDTGDDSPTSHFPSHAPYAALPSRVGAGDHPGPDQSRRGPRRGRGEDRRQAPGAGLRETARSPGLPGQQQRQHQRGPLHLQGEQGYHQGPSGTGLMWAKTTRLDPARRT